MRPCDVIPFFNIIFPIKSSYLSLLHGNSQKLAIKQTLKKILSGHHVPSTTTSSHLFTISKATIEGNTNNYANMCLTKKLAQWLWETIQDQQYQQLNVRAQIFSFFSFRIRVWVPNVGCTVSEAYACCVVARIT